MDLGAGVTGSEDPPLGRQKAAYCVQMNQKISSFATVAKIEQTQVRLYLH
jgi:hypothetical protein